MHDLKRAYLSSLRVVGSFWVGRLREAATESMKKRELHGGGWSMIGLLPVYEEAQLAEEVHHPANMLQKA